MVNPTSIKSGLLGLIGWRQNANPTGTQLTGLTTSSSGLYYNDTHPLLTFQNLESVAPDFDKWGLTVNTAFTAWLQEKTEQSIISALRDFLQEKAINKSVRSVLASGRIPEVTYKNSTLDVRGSNWRGLEIIPSPSSLIDIHISRIGFFSDTAQTVTLKLFASDDETEKQTQNIIVTDNTLTWADVDWQLNGRVANYIIYDDSAISGQSINNVTSAIPNTRFFNIVGVDTGVDVGGQMWDLSTNERSASTNYGVHIEYQVNTDLTQLLIDNDDQFANLIQLRCAMDMLRELAYNSNVRDNRNNNGIDRENVLYELDGDDRTGHGGLAQRYREALDALMLDVSGIDREFLKCVNKGVTYGTV